MKRQFIRLAGICSLVLIAVVATAGTWSDHQFIYKPDLGARGPSEKANFDTGLVRVDAHLGKYKTLGDPNYTTLAQALTTIGSTQVTLTIPAGTVVVSGNTAIPANIALGVQKGGKFEVASGVTLTISGTVEAGPYQIFAGSGAVVFGGVSAIYDVWLASPPSTPEGTVAAPVGARFTKTNGSAPLVYVKESGAGNTGWVAASTLTHTHTPTQVSLGNVSNDAQLKRAAGDIGSFAEKTTPAGADLVLIEDSANSFNKKKVQIANLPGGSGGATTFTGLSDAPDSYTGQAGKVVRVNAGGTALEFGNPDHAHANKTYLDAINQNLGSTSSPTFAGTTINGNLLVSGTIDGVDVSSHKSRHEAGGADALAHQNLAGAGTNTHAQIDTHLANTSNPHAVTAAQVGAIASAADTVKDTHIDWGTGTGQVSADDIPDGAAKIIPTATQETNWDNHLANTSNPHSVTKTQVGLGNVTNDAQLKRAAGDINSFAEKAAPTGADLILIEDSANSYNKKKVQITNLPGGSGSTTFTGLTDAPDSYSGQAGKALRVNSGETALEFYTPSSAGGPKPYHVLGETGYATLAEALTTIGSTETTLVMPAEAGAVAVTGNCTIGRNIRLKIENGAYVNISDGVTLSIEGAVEAGAYKIFQWTGTGKPNLTKSPTVDCPLEWWGAQPGTGNDISTALNKVDDCLDSHQNVIVSPGIWRIASPVTWTNTYGFGLWGGTGNKQKHVIYVDVGAANDCITVGPTGANVYHYRFGNLMFVGPANSCKNALVLNRSHQMYNGPVNFILGATEFAVVQNGCEHNEFDWWLGADPAYVESTLGITYGRMANGVKLQAQDGWTNNTYNKIKITKTGSFSTPGGKGLYIKDSSNNIQITGTIEGIPGDNEGETGWGIYVENSSDIEFHNMHIEATQHGIYATKSNRLSFKNVTCAGCSRDVGGSGWLDTWIAAGGEWPVIQKIKLDHCQDITIDNCNLGDLIIGPTCQNITVIDVTKAEHKMQNDFAPDTVYFNSTYRDGHNPKSTFCLFGENRHNYMANTLLDRWQSDRPDGWDKSATITWTKTGAGQTDTTRHQAPYSAKIEANPGAGCNAVVKYTPSAETLEALKGSKAFVSCWAMLPSGQSWTDNAAFLVAHVDCPVWQPSTTYKVGDSVEGTSNWNIFVCTKAGASGATEPNWGSPNPGAKFTDGTVEWTVTSPERNTSGHMKLQTAEADGAWRKLVVDMPIPKSATSFYFYWRVYAQANGNPTTLYISEPMINVGTTPSRGLLPGLNEHQSSVQIGGNKMTWGSVIPTNSASPLYTQWAQKGDVHWNTGAAAGGSPGWVCTTSGLNNSGAVWKAMGNLAN